MDRALPVDSPAAVPDDELERHVAVASMANKVLNRDGFALDQLTARLSTLLGRTLIEQHNPMGPTMLCAFFLQAARNLGVEIKVKLIILKLFDRYVLNGAEQLYAQANQLLIATGVLPDLKPAPTCRFADQAPVGVAPESGEVPGEYDSVPQVFAALQELLSHVRGSMTPNLEANTLTQPISSRDLLCLLAPAAICACAG